MVMLLKVGARKEESLGREESREVRVQEEEKQAVCNGLDISSVDECLQCLHAFKPSYALALVVVGKVRRHMKPERRQPSHECNHHRYN